MRFSLEQMGHLTVLPEVQLTEKCEVQVAHANTRGWLGAATGIGGCEEEVEATNVLCIFLPFVAFVL